MPLYIIILLTLTTAVPAFAEDGSGNVATSDANEKPAIILVPLGGDDVPSYIPMIVDRLFEAKIDKTEAYSIFTREELAAVLDENDITLPETINEEIALEIGQRLGMDQVLFGDVTAENSDFIIETKIMDVEKGAVISKDSERSKDIKGLEEAVGKLTRSIVRNVLPEELVAEAVKTLDKAEQTDKEVAASESITAFEKLAEEDPEQALEMVGEPAREAIKETVREEIVEEEIQDLFEKEKEEKALVKKRKRQFWTMFSLEGLNQIGNLTGSLAAVMNTASLYSWSNYMNDNFMNDPYRQYLDNFQAYKGLQTFNYIFSAGGNTGLTLSHALFMDDVYSFSKTGRQVFALSYTLNIIGNAVSVLTNQLSFGSLHYYSEYSAATTDFTSKYENYRDLYGLSQIARYTTYGLWGVGLTGMLTASFLPGEETPMILSARSGLMLTLGGAFLSIGNVTSGLSVDYQGRAETAWINEHAKSDWVGPSLYDDYKLTADIFTYSSYGMFVIGGALTYLALILPSGNTDKAVDSREISFSVVPDMEGFGAVVSWRY